MEIQYSRYPCPTRLNGRRDAKKWFRPSGMSHHVPYANIIYLLHGHRRRLGHIAITSCSIHDGPGVILKDGFL